jgi:hypothetical protein
VSAQKAFPYVSGRNVVVEKIVFELLEAGQLLGQGQRAVSVRVQVCIHVASI